MSVKFNKTNLDRLLMTTPENYIKYAVNSYEMFQNDENLTLGW